MRFATIFILLFCWGNGAMADESRPNSHRVPATFNLDLDGIVRWEATGSVTSIPFSYGRARTLGGIFTLGITTAGLLGGKLALPDIVPFMRVVYPVGLGLGSFLIWQDYRDMFPEAELNPYKAYTESLVVNNPAQTVRFEKPSGTYLKGLIGRPALVDRLNGPPQLAKVEALQIEGTLQRGFEIRIDKEKSTALVTNQSDDSTQIVSLSTVRPATFCTKWIHRLRKKGD